MFDIGFWELVILFGLGLMVLGPERLPKVAAQMGRWAGQARQMARMLTTQMRDELNVDVEQPIRTDYSSRRPEPGKPPPQASAAEETDTKPDSDEVADAGP